MTELKILVSHICGNCINVATKVCVECKNKFCDHCSSTIHQKLPHFVMDIKSSVFCEHHLQEKANLICFTCKKMVCKDCVNPYLDGIHSKHQIIHEKEAVREIIQFDKERVMSGYLKSLETTKSSIEDRLVEYQKLQEALKILTSEIQRLSEDKIEENDYAKIALVSSKLIEEHLTKGKLKGVLKTEENNQIQVDPNDFESQEIGANRVEDLPKVEVKIQENDVNIFNTKAKREIKTFEAHNGGVLGLSVSPKSNTFISCSDDKTMKFWTLETNKLESEINLGASITSILYNLAGDKVCASLVNGNIVIEQIGGKGKQQVLKGHTKCINSIDINKDILASGSEDRTLRLWDISKAKQVALLKDSKDEITSVSINDLNFACGSLDETIRIYDLKTQKLLHSVVEESSVSVVKFFDEKTLFVGLQNGKLKAYDIREPKVPSKVYQGHEGQITTMCFHSYNSQLVSGSIDQKIKVWNIAKGQLEDTFLGHEGYIRSVISTGDYILSGSDDHQIKYWKV